MRGRGVRYRYYICDVFTGSRFGGNQLAVLPDARGLSGAQMQQITREFNFSESAFVLPAESGHTRRVRIFTPAREIPFAGHPNIGTAFVLAKTGAFGDLDGPLEVRFEEGAGVVPISIRQGDEGVIHCELTAPQGLSLGRSFATEEIAAALSLLPGDIDTSTHPPLEASAGLAFVMVRLRDIDALGQAAANIAAVRELETTDGRPSIFMYVPGAGNFDFQARMFAPLSGVAEDPATGSANCALAGLLAHLEPARDGDFAWRVCQGVEMGRPSVLDARAEKRDGQVSRIRIGGTSVMFGDGYIDIDQQP